MKIWVLSDLHFEFGGIAELAIPDADVCVCAGDVQSKGIVASLDWLDHHVAQHMPTVVVAGNHEFYHAENGFIDEIIRGQAFKPRGQLYFLEESAVQIQDTVFIGATLWTDFDVLGEDCSKLAMREAAASMNDYRLIKFNKEPFTRLRPHHTFRKHIYSRDYLAVGLHVHSTQKVVYVTHHAPSIRSVEKKYLNDLLTPSFASNLEHLMVDIGPSAWIHGHVHHRVDYICNRTRVVANPRGYPGEQCYAEYDFGFVVEV